MFNRNQESYRFILSLIQIDRRGAGEQRRNNLYHLFGEMVSEFRSQNLPEYETANKETVKHPTKPKIECF
jgi:hypothetical protein